MIDKLENCLKKHGFKNSVVTDYNTYCIVTIPTSELKDNNIINSELIRPVLFETETLIEEHNFDNKEFFIYKIRDIDSLEMYLLDWIEDNSLSGGRYETITRSSSCEYINNRYDVSIVNDDIGLVGTMFRFTPKQFVKNLNKQFGLCEDVRCQINKEYKNFTVDDCLEFMNLWSEETECSPFGCGSDEQWDWCTETINDKLFFLTYYRY